MKIKTINNLSEIEGKKVILRVDFNVPLKENGEIQDDSRITETLPTIQTLLEKNVRLIITSHLGRPKGEIKEELRLTKIAKHLSQLLGKEVQKIDTTVGDEAIMAVNKLKDGEILMLENVRFNPGEEKCDPEFTKSLASLADIFVMDAFGAAHRKHSSTAGLADYLPAYGGLLIEKEIEHLSPLLKGEIERPLTMIFGGAKIDTKIGVIKNFIDKADHFLLGGGLANTFLYAQEKNIGESLCEKDKKDLAQEIMASCTKEEQFLLPEDVVVAKEVSAEAESQNLDSSEIANDDKILDIGQKSAEKYSDIIKKSGTVIWNGPLGLYEIKSFQNGSKTVAEALAESDCTSIIGGGDTADCIKRFNIPEEKFTHISTGGGACLEYLAGDNLPGIKILIDS